MDNAAEDTKRRYDESNLQETSSQSVGPEELKALDDDSLLGLIAQEREDAFRHLIERHIDQGYAVAYRILHNGADAEDVVQDAFLQVWSRRGSWLPGKARFSTWLFRVVSNRCIDLLRKSKPETVDDLPEIEDGSSNQSLELEFQEASEILEYAMAKLPDQQRIAIVFSYSESMSNGEIAEVMETTVSAVESLLKRGRQNLRLHLKKHSAEIQALFTSG